ncbi:transglycosylase SLT domain-containing protein [Neobacillus sp. PS3-34]|uniref:transglycosylase SLT domain-containing protein n=1 Tax=Neobacillus sp. PS3-34 TaxID=3070678 RepID=UPI0027DEE310|nr:transglycosylase SLT domain-containing protein [Neobacillus sp. PS3-34]WML46727.1 transglycosylase SLT domain-containing protein [Neobacillus sp. PS3-34]
MRKILLTVGLLTFLSLGLGHGHASAESDLVSKCGKVTQNQNPSFQQLNCLLTNAALEANIPPEVVKAVAWQENGWKQFNADGSPSISDDSGIGVMQITNYPGYDEEKLKTDILYNIESGAKILSSKYDQGNLPKIKGARRQDIENWYFAVMAYNGTKPVNSPLFKDTGKPNPDAYQEKVFKYIEENSFLGDTKLAKFPFKTTDFKYDSNSDANIEFTTRVYTLSEKLHPSNYYYNKGVKVATTIDNANLRAQPGTSQSVKLLGKFSALTITGNFVYDQSSDSQNQFVWYPVMSGDKKVGYISSSYITAPVCTPCLQYHKGEIIPWDRDKLVPGQLGRLTVLQNTPLFKLDGTFVRMLKKGDPLYRIYAFKPGMLSVGGGLYVNRDEKVKYETPSKSKLDAVKCIANYY